MKSTLRETALSKSHYDFRKSNWGMTKQEVKLAERIYPMSESKTHITYSDIIIGLEAIVGFHFEDDLLIEAGYAFREVFKEKDFYFLQYNRVKLMLNHRYGESLIR